MSGVFGIATANPDVQVSFLANKILTSLCHKEWFVCEKFISDNKDVSIGRVGIGIFNKEPQPFLSPDGNLVTFMTGEFYNADKLRNKAGYKGRQFKTNSDLELVINLYQENGAKFIEYLEGIFVLVLLDKNRNELIVANDRFGLYPIYYAHYDKKVIFAPEMKGILCDYEFRKKIDMTALSEYIRFQHLLGDKTFFEGIKLLPNASILRYKIDSDNLDITQYWDFSKLPYSSTKLTFREAVEEGSRLFEAGINKLSKGNYRFGVFLSGGLDSRVILGMLSHKISPITTITYGQSYSRDVVYAKRIADKIGSKHYYFPFHNGIWVKDFADFHLELTEGFHSWIHAHGISILEECRNLIDVNITGLHGAPLNWEDINLYNSKDDTAFVCKMFDLLNNNTTWPSINDGEEKFLFSHRLSSQMNCRALDSLRLELTKYDNLSFDRKAAQFSLNVERRFFKYYVVFNMSYIENRFPFYDYQYFDFIHSLPPEYLFNRKLRRAIILKTMRPLASIPYDKDNLPLTQVSALIAKLLQKTKSFTNNYIKSTFTEYATLNADYENWLRNELRSWGEKILFDKITKQRDIFNPSFLHSLWRRHLSGKEFHTIGKIAPIMTYEMMLRRFYD